MSLIRPVSFTLVGVKPEAPFITRNLKLSQDNPCILIGRSSKNRADVTPKADNAFFDCPVVSRRHAELLLEENGEIKIRDLESLHGTLVNQFKMAIHKPYALKDGDVVTIGNSITLGRGMYSFANRPPVVDLLTCFLDNYKAIVFQLQISYHHSSNEVIDLSSPVPSPKPAEASTAPAPAPPIWAQPKAGLSGSIFQTRPVAKHTTNTFVVPDDDDDLSTSGSSDLEISNEATRGHPSTPSAHDEDSDSGTSSSDYSEIETDAFEPLKLIDSDADAPAQDAEHPDKQSDGSAVVQAPDTPEPTRESCIRDTYHVSVETDHEEDDDADTSPARSNFTPESSHTNSPVRSPVSAFKKPLVQAGPQPHKTSGFLSRILSDTDSDGHMRQQSLPPSSEVNVGQPTNPQQPSGLQASSSQHDGNYTSSRISVPHFMSDNPSTIIDSSPYYSCFSQPTTSQGLAEASKDIERFHQGPSRPLYVPDCTTCTVPGHIEQDPFDFPAANNWDSFGSRPNARPVKSLPFSTWGPTPHEPHPFYPVHGVSDVPLAVPPWSSSATFVLPPPSPPLPPSGFQRGASFNAQKPTQMPSANAPAQPSGVTVGAQEPTRLAKIGSRETKQDLSRISIPNIVCESTTTQPATEEPSEKVNGKLSEKSNQKPTKTSLEPSNDRKRKIDDLHAACLDNDAQYLELPESFPSEAVSTAGTPQPAVPAPTPAEPSALKDDDVERPPKRMRIAPIQASEHKQLLPRRSRARSVAHTAAKYTLAGAVGGVFALTGLLALPSSLFH